MNTKVQTISRRSPAVQRAMRVVCGIDASRADAAAVRAALLLARERGHIAFVCVTHVTGVGATAQATIAPERAAGALERAMKQAQAAGIGSSVYLLRSPHASDALLQAAQNGDILVVGARHGGRAGGIALGSVATSALHRAPVPVLVARATGDAEAILVASDGSAGSDAACDLAGAIAARVGAPVALLTVGVDVDEAARHALARQTVELTEATGREPSIVHGSGRAADAIVEAAADDFALVVLGSTGRTGLRALGSVSERVAHRAPCSVLVARPRPAVGQRP